MCIVNHPNYTREYTIIILLLKTEEIYISAPPILKGKSWSISYPSNTAILAYQDAFGRGTTLSELYD